MSVILAPLLPEPPDPDAWRFLCEDAAGALLGVALAACIRGAWASRRPDVCWAAPCVRGCA
nr:hypothetical protein [Actinomycetota bacterium]